ncbi:hypothetical protein Hanom_Chr09g00762061 [Helianthus anomalus]
MMKIWHRRNDGGGVCGNERWGFIKVEIWRDGFGTKDFLITGEFLSSTGR